MRRRQDQPSVVLVWFTLLGGVSSQCCPSISVTSTSVGEEYQEGQLGIYTIKDNLTVNGRPVYKQVRGDQYFYYWVSSEVVVGKEVLNDIGRFSPRTDMMMERTGW